MKPGIISLSELQELDISSDQITYCISTHGHSDHTGNNNLFLNAKQHIVGFCVSRKETYYAHPFEHGNNKNPFEKKRFFEMQLNSFIN